MSAPRYAFDEPGRFGRGWYIMTFSQELAAGEIRSLSYFNRELVLFRGHNGVAALVDAYCPHLGAHLGGVGSEVVGDTIRCPFHGWQFDASGNCTHIPYSESIPARASGALESWTVRERNGFIAAWYDPAGDPPDWELPDIPEWGAAAWGDWQFRRSRVRCKGKEIVENIVDVGHFGSVHGGKVQLFENDFDGIRVTQHSIVTQDPDARMIIPPGLDIDLASFREGSAERPTSEGWATWHGPGVMYFYTENPEAQFPYRSWWVNYYVPVDDEQLDLASSVIVAPLGGNELPEEFRALYPEVAHAAFWQDVVIWETKVYREDPILCAGDGPVTKLRRWYEQFFVDAR
jgi:3-ketosteroid 9alpha-monooxygenase subunit A